MGVLVYGLSVSPWSSSSISRRCDKEELKGGMLIEPASSAVVPASAVAWAALLAGLQASGVATRGVPSSQGGGATLSAADRLRWDARVVSTLHALVLVLGAISSGRQRGPCIRLRDTSSLRRGAAVADIWHAHTARLAGLPHTQSLVHNLSAVTSGHQHHTAEVARGLITVKSRTSAAQAAACASTTH